MHIEERGWVNEERGWVNEERGWEKAQILLINC